jgi:aspartyl-tRNA synthetase
VSNPYRSDRAGVLGVGDEGRQVRLAGWVARRRDHGGIAFLDLRDSTGIVQVVVDPGAVPAVHDVRSEWCLSIEGMVRRRPDGTVNPDLPTGEVEVAGDSLTVLSPAGGLPFQLDDRAEIDEKTRLEFRYLDLRRPRMAANLVARSRAVAAIRRSLDDLGFLEVETPTLIRSTPEGARDLLVPSRHQPGSFFALPQSPQLFKQLLMVSGVERYFQIARCYRDEDFRSDRQVEFTQLDLEGAFWEEPEVQAAIEAAVSAAVEAVRHVPPPLPFPRMTWSDAMDRFGTDKPDVRFGMELTDLSAVFADTGFAGFAGVIDQGGSVVGLDVGPLGLSRSGLDGLVARARELGASGLVWMVVEGSGAVRSPVAKVLTGGEIEGVVDALDAVEGDTLLLVADVKRRWAQGVLGQLRLDLGRPPGHDELAFLWVTDFPAFEETATGQLAPSHHPFTAPVDVAAMEERPAEAVSRAYDLVVNGNELGSGSIRIHDPEVQSRVFEILGISADEAEQRFGWFLRALRFGAPPHGGFAFGIDRLVAVLRDEPNIREVMPFPKTQTGSDPLTGAPTPVGVDQLEELGIRFTPTREA